MENVTNSLEVAPEAELEDEDKAVLLRGEVLDRGCRGVAGATVDVWYGAQEDRNGENHFLQFEFDLTLMSTQHSVPSCNSET